MTSRTTRPGLRLLVATHAVNDFYTGAVAALLPFLVLEQHYDYAAVAGLTLAATSVSSVAQPVFGYLSDRFSLRWLVIAGLGVAAAGIAVSGLVSSTYWLIWVVIAISGLGVAAYHPAATMAAREAGGGSNRSMSIFSVGGNVGVALAPTAVILTVGSFGLGSTPLLVIPAVIISVVYLARSRSALALRLDGPSVESGRSLVIDVVEPDAPGAPNASGIMTSRPNADELDSAGPIVPANLPKDAWGRFGLLTLVLAFWSVAYVGTNSFISLYSIQRFEVTEATASIALTVFPAAGAAGTLAGGFLADRFGRMRIIRSGYAIAALSLLAVVIAPDPAVVVGATAVLGFALFLPFAPQITLSHSYLPNRVGMASGLTLGLTLSLGGFLNPLLGVLADATSIQSVFALLAGVLAVGFALSFLLRERRAAIELRPMLGRAR